MQITQLNELIYIYQEIAFMVCSDSDLNNISKIFRIRLSILALLSFVKSNHHLLLNFQVLSLL